MSLKNLQDWNEQTVKAPSSGCGTKPSACGSKPSACGAKTKASSCGTK